jgi:hypothetical protein
MSKIVDVRSDGGDFVILGKALVLPASTSDGADLPLDGSIRFNPDSDAVEVYVQGNWAPLGSGSGEGGGPAHNHTTSQITDLNNLLAGKANLVHVHPFNEIPGLQEALDGKTNTGHQHSIANVISLQTSLDDLQAQINARAPTSHNHAIANVTGLQTALDGKAPSTHFHEPFQVQGLVAHINMTKMAQLTCCYQGKPTASARVSVTTAHRFDIPNNFAGSFCRPYIIPTAPVSIVVRHNSLPTGTIAIDAAGAVTMTTSSGIGIIMNPGDSLSFHFPETPDTTLETISFCIFGERK